MARYKFPAAKPAAAKGAGGPPRVPVDPYITILETRYPRILDTITTLWGFQELNVFFRKLTIDDRGGRQGFPPDAWEEIQGLWDLHVFLVPEKNLF